MGLKRHKIQCMSINQASSELIKILAIEFILMTTIYIRGSVVVFSRKCFMCNQRNLIN